MKLIQNLIIVLILLALFACSDQPSVTNPSMVHGQPVTDHKDRDQIQQPVFKLIDQFEIYVDNESSTRKRSYLDWVKPFKGNIFFYRYDKTGNAKEIVYYDFWNKRMINQYKLPSAHSHKLILATDDFIIVSIYKRFIVYDSKTTQVKKKFKDHFKGAVIYNQELVLHKWLDMSSSELQFYNLNSLARNKTIKLDCYASTQNDSTLLAVNNHLIVITGKQIYVINESGQVVHKVYHPDSGRGNSTCGLFSPVATDTYLLYNGYCGKLIALDPATGMETVFDYLDSRRFLSIASDDSLVFIGDHNSKHPIEIIDLKQNKLIYKLPFISKQVFVLQGKLVTVTNEDRRHTIFKIYSINSKAIRSKKYIRESITAANIEAKEVYQSFKDVYKAIDILKTANTDLLVTDSYDMEPHLRASILNNYGYFLLHSFAYYKDAIPVLEKVVEIAPSSHVAYLNLADVFWKDFQRSGDHSSAKKAVDYYKTYTSVLKSNRRTGPPIKRDYNKQRVSESTLQGIYFKSTPEDKWFFEDDFIFKSVRDCYQPNGSVHIDILDRQSLKKIDSIPIILCDGQEDRISNIVTADGKLFVSTVWRYKDPERNGIYIFDITSRALLQKRSLKEDQGINHLFLVSEMVWAGNTRFSLIAPKTLEVIKEVVTLPPLIVNAPEFVKRKYLEKFNSTENPSHLETFIGCIGASNQYLAIKENSHKINFLDLNTFESSATYEGDFSSLQFLADPGRVAVFSSENEEITLTVFDIKKKGKTILLKKPLEDTYRRYSRSKDTNLHLTSNSEYIFIGTGRDFVVYDMNTYQELIYFRHIVPGHNSDIQSETKNDRITRLLVDHGRLLIFTYNSPNSRAVDISVIKNMIGADIKTKDK